MNTKNCLLIFTRNPELGKVKTRLAKTLGDTKALDIYKFLIKHTVAITKNLKGTKQVYYSVKVREQDYWDDGIFEKHQQEGDDLGIRMQHAFEAAFSEGYKNVIIIGSDMYDLSQEDIEQAFGNLENNDVVIGPAEDGGYYLLGMKTLIPEVFKNKAWGTDSVLEDTKADLKSYSCNLLEERNDVDYYEDIKDHPAFKNFLDL
ncbi:MAG: TIGR04282 family arsenosugar biosynthesis glycosyltransferase [Flavobacteriaceae bacterium]|nr:TIGR04282 family arsenosugar biosynthesis glycosyltransferase [Flavobacteriaceae bacterium]